jgi:ribose transport system permease protein
MGLRLKKIKFSSRELTLLILIGLVVVVATVFKGNAFFNIKNFEAILIGITYDLLIALGMTLVLVLGGIDLSVGSVLAFTGVITTQLLQGGVSIWLSILAGLGAAGLIGAMNGFMIVRAHIPPFGHVPPIIFGGSKLLTGEDLEDPAILELYLNPPTFD